MRTTTRRAGVVLVLVLAVAAAGSSTGTLHIEYVGGSSMGVCGVAGEASDADGRPVGAFVATMEVVLLADGLVPTREVADGACVAWRAHVGRVAAWAGGQGVGRALQTCVGGDEVVLWRADGTRVDGPVFACEGCAGGGAMRVYMGVGDDQWAWPGVGGADVIDVATTAPAWTADALPGYVALNVPLRLTRLAARPALFHVTKLLSVSETWYLRRLAARAGLSASFLVDGSVDAGRRSSQTASLVDAELSGDPLVLAIRARAQSLLRLDDSVAYASVEAFQVVRYTKGDHFGLHYDPLVPEDRVHGSSTHLADAPNRYATLFVYLGPDSEYDAGGRPPPDNVKASPAAPGSPTIFPFARTAADADAFCKNQGGKTCRPAPGFELADGDPCAAVPEGQGVRIEPDQGDAVLFYSMHPSGQAAAAVDPWSLHGGCEVPTSTAKWGLNIWFAARPITHPDGSVFVTPGRTAYLGGKGRGGRPGALDAFDADYGFDDDEFDDEL